MLQDPTNTTTGTHSAIPGWRTNPDAAAPIVLPDATLTLIAPPSSGEVDVASDEATVASDGNTLGDVLITPTIVSAPPGGSGTFTPTTLTLNSNSNPSDGFTFTPDTVGDYSIGIDNDRGFTNPDPFTYQSQDPYVAPELDNNWIVDLHPKRPFAASQGEVPAGSVDHEGEANNFNAQTQVCGTSIASIGLNNAGTATAGTLDSDSLTRNGFEWLRIITDPDNASRDCYEIRLDSTASNWAANKGKATRAQFAATGDPRRARPWGVRTWIAYALRIPATMKALTNTGFIIFGGYHTSQNDIGTGGGHSSLSFNSGGSTPENANLHVLVNTWSAPNWATTSAGGKEGPKYTLPLFSGGSNVNNQVPEDTWIYIILETALWHGFPDLRSPYETPTPAGPFYIKPYVAVADGSLVPKPVHSGTWGYPYGDTAASGWPYPAYPTNAIYTNPKSGSNWEATGMRVLSLGMREWLVSDIEATNPGRTITAHDIIAAFKASRLVTP